MHAPTIVVRNPLSRCIYTDRLGWGLGAMAGIRAQTEFSIVYTVSNPEETKNKVLATAVKDSMRKAEVLCGAAGVELGEIQSVDYSWGELDIYSRPMGVDMMDSYSDDEEDDVSMLKEIDIEPDDIDITDTVTVLWAIK